MDPSSEQSLGAKTFRLLMTFTQTAGPDVSDTLEARWIAPGLEEDFMTPLADVRDRTYQTRPAIAEPREPDLEEEALPEAAFELRFAWNGAVRECRWVWPLVPQHDGRWVLQVTAENTAQPVQAR